MTELVGTVVQLLGKEVSVRVETEHGALDVSCFLRGRLFDPSNRDLRRQIAVGDDVELELVEEPGGETGALRGILHAIRERRTLLVRRVPGRRRLLQAVAANVDRLVVVSALREPRFKTGLIDRYLVLAHAAELSPAICMNKIDLADPRELDEARAELSLYGELGYPVVWTSAETGEGLPELRELVRDGRSVIAGHSGVGKSALGRALAPGVELPSGSVDKRGRGRHTTTSARLVALPSGGELVDTPGVRELSLDPVGRDELARGFVEFRPHLDRCRFASCSHVPEPGCAVKAAVEAGEIARARYESYRKLYEEMS